MKAEICCCMTTFKLENYLPILRKMQERNFNGRRRNSEPVLKRIYLLSNEGYRESERVAS